MPQMSMVGFVRNVLGLIYVKRLCLCAKCYFVKGSEVSIMSVK